jgi:hypothetical protein
MMAEDRGPQVAAVAILFLILSWVTVSLRVFVRTVLMKSFGADDVRTIGSLILYLPISITLAVLSRHVLIDCRCSLEQPKSLH